MIHIIFEAFIAKIATDQVRYEFRIRSYKSVKTCGEQVKIFAGCKRIWKTFKDFRKHTM